MDIFNNHNKPALKIDALIQSGKSPTEGNKPQMIRTEVYAGPHVVNFHWLYRKEVKNVVCK